jgi:NTE family protein
VTIDGLRYVDGGMRSSANADLASGHDRILVIAPMPELVEGYAATGGEVEVVEPDEASLAAFGTDPLAPAVRTPSAEAGYAQGVALASRIGRLWS